MAKVRDRLMQRAERLESLGKDKIKRLSSITNIRVSLKDKDDYKDEKLVGVSSMLEVEIHTKEGLKNVSVPVESSGDLDKEYIDLMGAFEEAIDTLSKGVESGGE